MSATIKPRYIERSDFFYWTAIFFSKFIIFHLIYLDWIPDVCFMTEPFFEKVFEKLYLQRQPCLWVNKVKSFLILYKLLEKKIIPDSSWISAVRLNQIIWQKIYFRYSKLLILKSSSPFSILIFFDHLELSEKIIGPAPKIILPANPCLSISSLCFIWSIKLCKTMYAIVENKTHITPFSNFTFLKLWLLYVSYV